MAHFDALTASSKQLVWCEQSGHEPFADEPAKFNQAMVELVRPAAIFGLTLERGAIERRSSTAV